MLDKSSSIYDRVVQEPGIADKAAGVEAKAPSLQYAAEAKQGHFFKPDEQLVDPICPVDAYQAEIANLCESDVPCLQYAFDVCIRGQLGKKD